MTTRTPHVVSAALALVLALAAASARADVVTVTLDDPNQTVNAPASGSITLDFTGSVTIATGHTFNQASLAFAFLENSAGPGIATTFNPLFFFSDANDGNTVSGLIFTAEVDLTTPPGLYGFEFDSTDPSALGRMDTR